MGIMYKNTHIHTYIYLKIIYIDRNHEVKSQSRGGGNAGECGNLKQGHELGLREDLQLVVDGKHPEPLDKRLPHQSV